MYACPQDPEAERRHWLKLLRVAREIRPRRRTYDSDRSAAGRAVRDRLEGVCLTGPDTVASGKLWYDSFGGSRVGLVA